MVTSDTPNNSIIAREIQIESRLGFLSLRNSIDCNLKSRQAILLFRGSCIKGCYFEDICTLSIFRVAKICASPCIDILEKLNFRGIATGKFKLCVNALEEHGSKED